MKTTVIAGILALATTAAAAPGADKYVKGGKGKGQETCACPTNTAQPDGTLGQTWVNTDLLVPISKNAPDVTFPATKWAMVTPNDVCTIFNLNLPVTETQGKVCNLVFDFPSQEQAARRFFFYGPGTFQFTGYAIGAGAVAGETTYNHQPASGPSPPNPPPTMTPGHSYIVNSAPCGIPAELPGTVTVSGSLCSPDTFFTFKHGNDSCPLGFFVVLTDI